MGACSLDSFYFTVTWQFTVPARLGRSKKSHQHARKVAGITSSVHTTPGVLLVGALMASLRDKSKTSQQEDGECFSDGGSLSRNRANLTASAEFKGTTSPKSEHEMDKLLPQDDTTHC